MANQKETIILAGSGHKGVVRLYFTGGQSVRGSCSLDFRPSGATLYLIGDNIAQIALNDINTSFETPFCANSGASCVVRSSAFTLFGGEGARSEMLSKIDAFNKQKSSLATATLKDEQQSQIEQDKGDVAASAAPSFDKKIDARDVKPLDWTKYDGNNFYYAIKPQLDEMFVCYPRHDELESAVQNSKWVRVDADDSYYAVGLLFDGDEPAFICYAVPEYVKNRRPPTEIENM